MSLNFPNPSRSYDATRHCVRFWAHDGALEIPFFVEEGALCRVDAKVARNETEFLAAFDLSRERIMKAAGKAYTRHSKGSYTLTASDLR